MSWLAPRFKNLAETCFALLCFTSWDQREMSEVSQ